MHLLEPFRWRLVEVPFDLDYPYWVEAEDFDLEFHVRELALPAPGTREQLAEQVARITARPLDRSRPLWEFYVIQGLEDGLVGLQTKIHHAAVDGASGSEILSVLFDVQPQPDIPPPTEQRKPERVPGDLELVSRALTRLATQPLQAALTLGRLSTSLAKAGASAASSRDGGILGSLAVSGAAGELQCQGDAASTLRVCGGRLGEGQADQACVRCDGERCRARDVCGRTSSLAARAWRVAGSAARRRGSNFGANAGGAGDVWQ